MKVWEKGGDFRVALQADPEVTAALPPERLDALFDMAHHTRHVDTIFRRVFADA
jgi:adenylosuccinate lyase